MRKNNFLTSKKGILLSALAIVVIAVVIAAFALKKSNDKNAATDTVGGDTNQTTSTAPTAQPDYTGGDDRPIPDDNKIEGTVEDNEGRDVSVPEKNDWSVSSTGEITVYSPVKNALISSGDKFTGASKLANINFRLIDNVSGQIAEGQLKVVDGKFSGTFNFDTDATEGRLDIFATKEDGVEYSNVEVPLRFQ